MTLVKFKDYFSQNTESTHYLPIAEWTGRLILLLREQRQTDDAVLFKVPNVAKAHQDLIGTVVGLKWSRAPKVQAFVTSITRDITFTEATVKSQKKGLVHPERLNDLKHVGPLESLAGARPQDDVIVMLPSPVTVSMTPGKSPALVIGQQPVQITGSIYALVTIIRQEGRSDRFVVRHFNRATKQFDGLSDIICIPQAQPDKRGFLDPPIEGLKTPRLTRRAGTFMASKQLMAFLSPKRSCPVRFY